MHHRLKWAERCQSAGNLAPLAASKNDPLGALGSLARCGVAFKQRAVSRATG